MTGALQSRQCLYPVLNIKKERQFPFLYLGILCTAAWADVVQCHLVKGLGGKYFYKLPKSGLAGKFQMCFHEKAVRSRWCLSPVL